MSVTCSSKVIFLATEGDSTTFGLRYGSYDKIWGENQGTSHKKAHIDVVP
jgi:hypothetical protein